MARAHNCLSDAFPPSDSFPHGFLQINGQLVHRDRMMLRNPTDSLWLASVSRPSRYRLGRIARLWDGHVLVHAHRVEQMHAGEAFAKLAVVAKDGIGRYRRRGDFPLDGTANLAEGNRRYV